jgi:hypothetical protein
MDNECKDVLFGANAMLACYCNEHDYCNTAASIVDAKELAVAAVAIALLIQWIPV